MSEKSRDFLGGKCELTFNDKCGKVQEDAM